ncbi:helix-turn-helix transcriptional regulator [Marinomonas gallaica]|jgi:prophage regulatory protein|uniref:helix-turn-helix transcriptional regulator n=1 Tax=Marinomonas gallaica TaxID=1806667 RepID=UPI0008364A00|nr:hypothetical protein [Marinomonas gallaica]
MSDMTLQERRAQILKVYGETERFICEAERKKITQISRTTWWRWSKVGAAPVASKLSSGKSMWLLSDLLLWMNSN